MGHRVRRHRRPAPGSQPQPAAHRPAGLRRGHRRRTPPGQHGRICARPALGGQRQHPRAAHLGPGGPCQRRRLGLRREGAAARRSLDQGRQGHAAPGRHHQRQVARNRAVRAHGQGLLARSDRRRQPPPGFSRRWPGLRHPKCLRPADRQTHGRAHRCDAGLFRQHPLSPAQPDRCAAVHQRADRRPCRLLARPAHEGYPGARGCQATGPHQSAELR